MGSGEQPVRGWAYGEVDVVVVGSGAAGAAAAIAAHDAGGRALILEKLSTPGGLSILSGGGLAGATDARHAEAYLRSTLPIRRPPFFGVPGLAGRHEHARRSPA